MSDRRDLLNYCNLNSTDDVCRENKASLYNSQENTYTVVIRCGVNPFINFEGKKYYMPGR